MKHPKKIPSAFEGILKQAENLLASDPSAQQVFAARTFGGRILLFANHDIVSGSTADETAFIRTLGESGDTEIQYAVCVWSDSTLDVPSLHFRELLADVNPSNRNAEFLLASSESFLIKPLKALIPSGR